LLTEKRFLRNKKLIKVLNNLYDVIFPHHSKRKIEKIISLGKFILQQKSITIRCLASFIGLVVHAFYAVTFGPLYYRGLERNKISALNFNNGDFDSEIYFSLLSEKF
jgi:hypothetical protein